MLYYEISEPDTFISTLSREIGIKIVPTTALDLVLSYLSTSYCHYHQLPENQVIGLDRVLKVLSEASGLYNKRYGKLRTCM